MGVTRIPAFVRGTAREASRAWGDGAPYSPAGTALAFSVAVFAYNEQRLIGRCLESILAAAGGARIAVHVLINGCTDRTEDCVAALAARHPCIRPVVLARGDKANSWNVYVHELAPDVLTHVFVDGDMQVTPGSFAALAAALRADHRAVAAAALPVSGRSREAFRRKLTVNHELAGNLYALRGETVGQLRARAMRMPVGMFGEDGLLATILKCDLDPRRPPCAARIVACPEAGFAFDPLSPWLRSSWRIYRNRKMRYAVRKQQARMLYPRLRAEGLAALPPHVVDLYRKAGGSMRLEWSGADTLFDYLAIRRIRRQIRQGETAKVVDEAGRYS